MHIPTRALFCLLCGLLITPEIPESGVTLAGRYKPRPAFSVGEVLESRENQELANKTSLRLTVTKQL